MGLSNAAYWWGWVSIGLVSSFLISNVLILSGYIYGFSFFTNTPYLILLMLFVFYSQAI